MHCAVRFSIFFSILGLKKQNKTKNKHKKQSTVGTFSRTVSRFHVLEWFSFLLVLYELHKHFGNDGGM